MEYQLEGIRQVAVQPKIGLTFARCLRSILRQDPDCIMVGEIRDGETAAMSIHAALTGHRVFSTLHTNTAVGAVTRILDMGVEPYLAAAALEGAAGQQLVRRLCPCCKKAYTVTEQDWEWEYLQLKEPRTLYRAQGCPSCGHTGYAGRIPPCIDGNSPAGHPAGNRGWSTGKAGPAGRVPAAVGRWKGKSPVWTDQRERTAAGPGVGGEYAAFMESF